MKSQSAIPKTISNNNEQNNIELETVKNKTNDENETNHKDTGRKESNDISQLKATVGIEETFSDYGDNVHLSENEQYKPTVTQTS